jgi:inositol transport system substrate-binding protein
MSGTVAQFPNEQAGTALRVLVEYIQDGTAPEDEVILLTPRVISSDNLDEASTRAID